MTSLFRLGRSIIRPNINLALRATFASGRGSKENIENLIKQDKIVVFMKGTADEPACGFSNAVIRILEMHGLDHDQFTAYNVLDDDEIRQGIKDFSNWPTIPQVYMDGEFIGGCDILIEMHQNGELIDELKKVGFESARAEDDTDNKS